MSDINSPIVLEEPIFITYLFTLNNYDCYFDVGNDKQIEPVRIGVVKQMLMAHSEVLRADMLHKDIEDKKCISVTDLEPDTFMNLLKYVYGYDNVGSMCFEDADNLLYAAEKYMIRPLKSRLSERLIDLLDCNNVCSLLNNPACFRSLELNSAITRILQYETDEILASPQFLELRAEAVVKILEQEAMNVEEIDVWRAAVKWAKHQTMNDGGQSLRNALEGPGKHIRVCTIDDYSFFNEVYPTGILTDKEAILVSSSKALKKPQSDLLSFSPELRRRTKTSISCNLSFDKFHEKFMGRDVELLILTKQHTLEIFPITCLGEHFDSCDYQSHLMCDCIYECTISITKIVDYVKNAPNVPSETFLVYSHVGYNGELTVPVVNNGKNIVLMPNSNYRFTMKFNEVVTMYESKFDNSYDNEHISVLINYPDRFNFFAIPFKNLFYRPLCCYSFQHIYVSKDISPTQ